MHWTVKEVSRVTMSTEVCVVTTREVHSFQLPLSRGNVAVVTLSVIRGLCWSEKVPTSLFYNY